TVIALPQRCVAPHRVSSALPLWSFSLPLLLSYLLLLPLSSSLLLVFSLLLSSPLPAVSLRASSLPLLSSPLLLASQQLPLASSSPLPLAVAAAVASFQVLYAATMASSLVPHHPLLSLFLA